MSVEEIRSQMESTARERWGEERAKALADEMRLTASALARMDAVTLSRSDDFDFLEGGVSYGEAP